MAEVITDLLLRKLAAPVSARTEIWDSRVPGFGLRISPSGNKSFIVVYRHKGRPRRLTLGRYPMMSLSEARQRAIEALRDAMLGVDPQQEKAAERIGVRFDETVALFVETYCKLHNREVTWRETERVLRTRFVSVWGARDLREITKSDVLAVLDGAVKEQAPSGANHALMAIRLFFNWCVGRGLLEISPCDRVKKPAKEVSRERVLSDL